MAVITPDISFDGAILAAGAGMRLRPATDGIPKPLVEIDGVTMLERQAAGLLAAGAGKVTAIVNSETARMLDRHPTPAVPIDIIVRDTPSSMETLLTLGEVLDTPGAPEPRLTLFATVDAIVPQAELNRFAADAIAAISHPNVGSGADSFDGALAVVRWRGDKRPLFAAIASGGLITALGDDPSDLVTAGFYMLPQGIFALAPLARARGLDALRRFLGLAIESGWRFCAIELRDVIDVDEGGDLADARALFSVPKVKTA
jgi:hypothetical protein